MNTININDYILTDETNANKGSIWLHNLPNDETLFDVIDKLREVYKEETLVFTEEIKIIEKIITKRIWLSKCDFMKKITFSRNVCKDFLYFKDILLYNKVFFHTNTFEKGVEFQGMRSLKKIEFSNSVFFDKLTILGIFNENVKFISCKVEGEAKILPRTIFKNEVSFVASKFHKSIDFSEIIFEQKVKFQYCKFEGNVRFHYTEFHNSVNFENASFEKLVDFYSAHFYRAQQFHFTDFLDRAIFSNTEFDEEVQFLHCRVDTRVSYMRFESAIFRRGLDISRSNFNTNVSFWDIKIEEEGVLYIFNNLESVEYANDFRTTGKTPEIYKQIRETYRIIKDSFYRQNNKIEGLYFYEKEMSVYLEEKRAEDEKTEGFFSDVSTKVIKIKDQIKKASYNLQPFFTKLKNNIIISNLFVYTIPVIIDRKTRMGIKYVLLFFSVVSLSLYMIEKSYYWFWLLALALILLVLLKFYENRKSTREIVKQNNYISPLLLFIMTIIFLVIIYGQEDFKNDWAYKTIHWFLLQISKILNDQLGLSIVIIIALMSFAMLFIVVLREHDKITLWFNKNSNKFDTNWIAGVNFSILVGFITYFMVLLFMNNDIELDTSTEGISNFITSLVDVFNLTKWGDLKIIDIRLEGFPYLLLFIGRIFIGYGYYQTIQAFRKFGKS